MAFLVPSLRHHDAAAAGIPTRSPGTAAPAGHSQDMIPSQVCRRRPQPGAAALATCIWNRDRLYVRSSYQYVLRTNRYVPCYSMVPT